MAFLGVPYRILYEAKGLETGLTGIQVRVLRPGGVATDGPFTLTELPAPFRGRYIYDYTNDDTFPQGDYFAFISSPGDATFTTFRFELFHAWATAISLGNIVYVKSPPTPPNVVVAPPPPDPSRCVVYGYLIDIAGEPVRCEKISFSIPKVYSDSQEHIVEPETLCVETNQAGYFEQILIRSSEYDKPTKVKVTIKSKTVSITVPDQVTANITDLIS